MMELTDHSVDSSLASLLDGDIPTGNIDADKENQGGPPPPKRLKLIVPGAPVQPNFDNLKSDNYKLFRWEADLLKWKCRLCGKLYSHPAAGGSGSCGKHLLKHRAEIDEAGGILPLAAQLNLAEANGPNCFLQPTTGGGSLEFEIITEEGYKDHLVEMIVCTNSACAIVAESSFNKYGKYISSNNSRCKNPCPTTLITWIHSTFDKTQASVMKMLQCNPSKISFILDCWTSANQKPFQGVIANWINQNWKLCHTPIDLTVLQGSHAGRNLAQSFSAVLDRWGLWKQLLSITTDNAGNMETFFRHFQKEAKNKLVDFDPIEYRIRCAAHIINLVCQAVIKALVSFIPNETEDEDDSSDDERDSSLILAPVEAKTFLDKLRVATRTIKASPQRREYFEEKCKEHGISPKQLLQDCETRWNSTLQMLRRLVELRQPFLSTCHFVRKLRKLGLHNDEELWVKTKQLIEMLEPFEKATLKLSQAHSPTLSDVTSVYEYLFNKLDIYVDKRGDQGTRSSSFVPKPEWLKIAATAGLNKLTKYRGYASNTVNVLATALDPRYKLKWYATSWTTAQCNSARQKLNNVWNTYKSSSTNSASQELSLSPFQNDEIACSSANKLKAYYKPEDELKAYLREPLLPMKEGFEGSLDWWKKHAVVYPILPKMAMDFLAVPATGVPVERLFSCGPDTIKNKQMNMKANTLRERILLRQWMKNSDGKVFELDIINDAARGMIENDDD